MTVALTHFAARCGDHNDRAMQASPLLAQVLAERLGTAPTVIGGPSRSAPGPWDEELAIAMPVLGEMAAHLDLLLAAGCRPVTALSRCAVALATLPVVARHHPEAVVVWFDAHADLNTPADTATGYLGGLALSGPLGLWSSGLGAGLAMDQTVLVGARDLDAPERRRVGDDAVALVPVGERMADELRRVVAGRAVYVHLDCDVLEPGIVPTDYAVPGGMTLAELTDCAHVLAESTVVGLEIGELEAADISGTAADDAAGPARSIVAALDPLLERVIDAPRCPHSV